HRSGRRKAETQEIHSRNPRSAETNQSKNCRVKSLLFVCAEGAHKQQNYRELRKEAAHKGGSSFRPLWPHLCGRGCIVSPSRPNNFSRTSGVPQIAADLLPRPSRLHWAKTGCEHLQKTLNSSIPQPRKWSRIVLYVLAVLTVFRTRRNSSINGAMMA